MPYISLSPSTALVDSSRRLRAELDLLKHRESQRQRELELDKDKDWDLEALLRSNADQDWAHGPECAPYPRYEDLVWKNPHFQETRAGNLTYYLFGAYYDWRPAVAEVMVLAMITTWEAPYPDTYCQMWFEGERLPELVPLKETNLAWYPQWGKAKGVAYPTLLTFPMRSPRIPQLVSLVFGNSCSVPQNALKVVQPPERARAPTHHRRRLRTGVCLKYLRYPKGDMSERLVEWLELMRLLGATRIRAYDIGELHANISRTLARYTRPEDGLLETGSPPDAADGRPVAFAVPAAERGAALQRLPVPEHVRVRLRGHSRRGRGDHAAGPAPQLAGPARGAGGARCELHGAERLLLQQRLLPQGAAPDPDPRIPPGFHMLRHVTRVAEHLDPSLAPKCLHNTAYATVVHNHFALNWRNSCRPKHVEVTLGQMQHYRHVDKPETLKEPPPKLDDNIRRFQQQLVHNVLEVHRQLGWRGATP